MYKTTAGGAVEYLHFGGDVVTEKNASTGAFTDYIYFNGKRVARRDPSGSVHYWPVGS